VLDLVAALMRQGLICITHLHLDAALYEPAAPREAGAKGRARKKGAPLPMLSQRLHDANPEWQSVTVSGWYGNTERRLEICSDSAVWYHAGVTDAVHEDVLAWRDRLLEPVYPVVFLDALRVRIRHDGVVKNKAVYVVLALTQSGAKEVLGLWVEQTQGARFWLGVLNELKGRGVEDILSAVVDGLKGFPEAIEAVIPRTMTQTRWTRSTGRTAKP
jgi:hypothetical protein